MIQRFEEDCVCSTFSLSPFFDQVVCDTLMYYSDGVEQSYQCQLRMSGLFS